MAKVAKLETATTPDAGMIPYEATASEPARIKILVEGRCPLLTHNPASMQNQPETKKGSNIPEPAEEAEAGTYRMEDGTCCLKGESFRGSALEASGDWKVPKKRYSFRWVLEHVSVVEDLVPLTRKDGTGIVDYSLDARRAIVNGSGIIRHRPRFDEWQTSFTIEYDPAVITDAKIIVDILNDAGSRKGVGDYRPRFGRFRVVSYKLL